MSKWEKLIENILSENPNLRFEDLCRALTEFGFTKAQPRGGSSHYTFRKPGVRPLTIPKANPIGKVYIHMVSDIVRQSLEGEAQQNKEQENTAIKPGKK